MTNPIVTFTVILYILVLLGQCFSCLRSWLMLRRESKKAAGKRMWKGLSWEDRFASVIVLKLFYTFTHIIGVSASFVTFLLNTDIINTQSAQLKVLPESLDYAVSADQYFAPDEIGIRQSLLVAQGFKQIAGFFVIAAFHTYTYYGPIKRFRAMEMVTQYNPKWNIVFDWVPRIVYTGTVLTYILAAVILCLASVSPDASMWQSIYALVTFNPLWSLYVVYAIIVSLVLHVLFFVYLQRYLALSRELAENPSISIHKNNALARIDRTEASITQQSQVQDQDPSNRDAHLTEEQKQVKQLTSRNSMRLVISTFTLLVGLGLLYVISSVIPMSFVYLEFFNVLGHVVIAIQLYVTEFYLENMQILCKLAFHGGK